MTSSPPAPHDDGEALCAYCLGSTADWKRRRKEKP